jgi:hypothetical protein
VYNNYEVSYVYKGVPDVHTLSWNSDDPYDEDIARDIMLSTAEMLKEDGATEIVVNIIKRPYY